MKTNAYLTAVVFVLLAFVFQGYRGGGVAVVAAHDISYGKQIQDSDLRVTNKTGTTTPSGNLKVGGVVGHLTVRNIHKGELVKNPGDVLPFVGPVPPGGLSRQQIDSLRN